MNRSIKPSISIIKSCWIVLVASLLTGLGGCKSNTPSGHASGEATSGASTSAGLPPAAPVDPAQAGTVTGTVHFKGTPPPRIRIDMSMDPACSFAGENPTEQYMVNKSGGLANVFVYIKDGLPASSAPPATAPVRVDQHGCRFIPHVVAVQQGGSVQFTNSDPAMHNVHTDAAVPGDDSIDVSQGPGAQPQVRRFNVAQGMIEIRCNNHPWMNGFLNVAPNPYFAVTNPDGSFTISGLPPGSYTLAAVHEKLGEQDVPVTVPAHGTSTTNLTFMMR